MPVFAEEISRSRRVGLTALALIKNTPVFLFDTLKSTAGQLKQKVSKIKAKDIPLYFLAVGASLSIGLLSFGGMFVLWPLLPIAFVAFALSVGYEGEIYVQNIKGSFKKSKANYLERKLAKECLLHDFKYTSGTDCPEFFKKYDALCAALEPFQHKNLDGASKKRKKLVEKKLSDMEKWFALQLFSGENEKETVNQKAVRAWVKKKPGDQQESLATKWGTIKLGQDRKFRGAKAFCVLSAILMGAGTIYLLVGTFLLIPFLAALPMAVLPMIILPMALIAGVAYYRIIHNSITDMISDKILVTWYHKIKTNFEQGNRVRGTFIILGLTVFLGLAVMLSICTAGTWWTVAKTTPVLFSWMRRLPGFIMLVVNPVVSSFSALLFNIVNVFNTLNQVDEATQGIDSLSAWLAAWLTMQVMAIRDDFQELRAKENWLQILNPVRILVNVLYTPLRLLAFLGHILSIGVTADRVAGVSPIMSGALGAVNEGVEDIHYFVGHEGSGTFDFISTDVTPDKDNFHSLRMISKAAFVRVKNNDGLDCLYYVNKMVDKDDKRFISIPMKPAQLTTFDEKIQFSNKVRMLSNKQVKFIEGLLPAHSLHNHDPESLRRERLSGEHGHTHEDDIPTKILDGIFWLPRRCAAGLDSFFSGWNKGTAREVLDYNKALDKQLGRVAVETVEFKVSYSNDCCNTQNKETAKNASGVYKFVAHKKKVEPLLKQPWQKDHAIFRIEKHKKELRDVWFDRDIAQKKIDKLTILQEQLKSESCSTSAEQLIVDDYKKNEQDYNAYGFFDREKKSVTAVFLQEELIERTYDLSLLCYPCTSIGG